MESCLNLSGRRCGSARRRRRSALRWSRLQPVTRNSDLLVLAAGFQDLDRTVTPARFPGRLVTRPAGPPGPVTVTRTPGRRGLLEVRVNAALPISKADVTATHTMARASSRWPWPEPPVTCRRLPIGSRRYIRWLRVMATSLRPCQVMQDSGVPRFRAL